jgi:hypothetical protein
MSETVEILRQEWYRCSFEWGLEDYVTVITEDAGRLILMSIEKFSSENCSGIRAVPVIKDSMNNY